MYMLHECVYLLDDIYKKQYDALRSLPSWPVVNMQMAFCCMMTIQVPGAQLQRLVNAVAVTYQKLPNAMPQGEY